MQRLLGVGASALMIAFGLSAVARADETVTITIENHRFEPAEITVPAGQRIDLVVVNKDQSPEEFESRDLKVEKIVTGKGTITVKIGPLKPGSYKFVGEFNSRTARGVLIAKE